VKLVWTPEARGDRDAIYTYIENDNPAAALDLDELFVKRAAHLLSHPMIGRPGRVANTRELVAHPNYILIYDIAGEMIRVIRVLHTAQQWPPRNP
jgi:addiction module RelE/StbE family toxin